MIPLNSKVDEYIAKSEDFAKPILEYLRQIIHETCPDAAEDIKWGTPHYAYKGDHLCMIAGFKNHCSFSLYKAEFIKNKEIAESVKAGKKFGYMDKLKSVSELPSKNILISLIKEAMTINEQGIKKEKTVSDKPKVIETPEYLVEALNANKKAKEVWESKSDSYRKDYLVWIIDAKTDTTRQKRIEQSLEWIAEGKGRFWQYEKK
ncbi:YdeI family protein [Flavobacterium sp. JAS]|uniref:YdeI/OmpD-associated family protein n=1 Tax=Flavobacterium sp. JAS TaxID=2897329 RepID=UPI001E47FBD9|nr:YdeI/OmpD-associated family protein [Flavobacterium sp. JAS]MCD0472277.1 YdeI/OmpD-associated family protein [Flavobacterium sp. JAS]